MHDRVVLLVAFLVLIIAAYIADVMRSRECVVGSLANSSRGSMWECVLGLATPSGLESLRFVADSGFDGPLVINASKVNQTTFHHDHNHSVKSKTPTGQTVHGVPGTVGIYNLRHRGKTNKPVLCTFVYNVPDTAPHVLTRDTIENYNLSITPDGVKSGVDTSGWKILTGPECQVPVQIIANPLFADDVMATLDTGFDGDILIGLQHDDLHAERVRYSDYTGVTIRAVYHGQARVVLNGEFEAKLVAVYSSCDVEPGEAVIGARLLRQLCDSWCIADGGVVKIAPCRQS